MAKAQKSTQSTKRILHVVTNVDHFEATGEPTGLWLSELTHAYDEFAKHGYQQDIISPQGGKVPLEPKSLTPLTADRATRKRQKDQAFMALLENSKKPSDINAPDYDAIYFTGGHGVMWDFLNNQDLHNITRTIYEKNGAVSSVCHGYCGLIKVKLSNDEHLIKGKTLTGFSWREEKVAGVAYQVPYNVEQLAQKYGAKFKKALLPFAKKVVVDGNLITGQNPASARKTALAVIEFLQS